MRGFATLGRSPATAMEVATTIFRASTDGSDKLRYPSGTDATMLLDARQNENDDTFFKRIAGLFAL